MVMTKKEQAAMQAAIDRAETLAALRWTGPVERDVGVPLQGYSEGWDYNAHSMRVWQGWSDRVAHGTGKAPEAGIASAEAREAGACSRRRQRHWLRCGTKWKRKPPPTCWGWTGRSPP